MSSVFPLAIQDLRKMYHKSSKEAVQGVSFEVGSGEIFGLLGPNGAGKTSIISMITTLEKPSAGSVKVFGNDVVAEPLLTKKMIGVVHQEVVNSVFFSVEEILNFQSGYYGLRNNKDRIHFLLQKLSLFEHRNKKVKQLSGGMKRRLMIAKALVHSPKLLLLDEPTAGVDLELRENLWNFVRELQKDGVSVLLTTHYLQEAEQLCDRIAIINEGKVVCVGKTQQIVSRYSLKKVQLTLTEPRAVDSEYLISAQNLDFVFMIPHEMLLGDFLSVLGIPTNLIRDLKIEEGGLEDVFIKMTNKSMSSEI